MSKIIENPDLDIKKIWGVLAHVSKEERERILLVPYGQFQFEIKIIENELKLLKKKRKKSNSGYKQLKMFKD